MKKIFGIMLLCATMVLSFSSCSKEDDFAYPMSDLYGTWDGIAIKTGNNWVDITNSWYSDFQFSITFYEGGEYYGRGYFGTGSGTYKTKGDVIYTYVNGESYRNYRVKSLTNNVAELDMFVEEGGTTIGLKVRKK